MHEGEGRAQEVFKHATASVFVFAVFDDAWWLGLIEHPRLGRWMIAGGHVEACETQAEAAVRESLEETGRQVRLLAAPALGVPEGFSRALMPMPWWITEQPVAPDSHVGERHVHVDHQYVAIAMSPAVVVQPAAHPFRWVSVDQLDGLGMFEDTRLLAHRLFPMMSALTAGVMDAAGVLSTLQVTAL